MTTKIKASDIKELTGSLTIKREGYEDVFIGLNGQYEGFQPDKSALIELAHHIWKSIVEGFEKEVEDI